MTNTAYRTCELATVAVAIS